MAGLHIQIRLAHLHIRIRAVLVAHRLASIQMIEEQLDRHSQADLNRLLANRISIAAHKHLMPIIRSARVRASKGAGPHSVAGLHSRAAFVAVAAGVNLPTLA
jgi:hypothetical protein